jgi:hypothetical protein
MEITRRTLGRMAASSLIVMALPPGRLLAAARAALPAGEVMGVPEHSIDPEVTIQSNQPGQMQAKASSKTHHKKATTAQYLSDGFDQIDFGQGGIQGRQKRESGQAAGSNSAASAGSNSVATTSGQDVQKNTQNKIGPNKEQTQQGLDSRELAAVEAIQGSIWPINGQMNVLIDFKGNWAFSGGFPAQKMPVPCDVALGMALKSSLGEVMGFTAHGTVPASGRPWSFSKQGHSAIVEDLWKHVVKGHDFHGDWYTIQKVPNSSQSSSNLVSQVASGFSLLGAILVIL